MILTSITPLMVTFETDTGKVTMVLNPVFDKELIKYIEENDFKIGDKIK